jgi:hypothetical protein
MLLLQIGACTSHSLDQKINKEIHHAKNNCSSNRIHPLTATWKFCHTVAGRWGRSSSPVPTEKLRARRRTLNDRTQMNRKLIGDCRLVSSLS